MGWWWPAAGLGALSTAGGAQNLLKEVTIRFIDSTIGWPQVKQQGENTALTINLLSMALPIRTRLSFPPQSVSPIRNLPEASYLSPSEGRQTENHNHRKLTKLIMWTTALSNSVKLRAMPCRATQDRPVMVESSDKTWSTGEGNGKPLQYSCLENPMNSMKRQKKGH